jgi:DNA primase
MAYRTLQEAISRGQGRERAFRCPVHPDHQASASVNVIKGVWFCYACGAKGTVDGVIDQEDQAFAKDVVGMLDEQVRIYPENWLDQFLNTVPGNTYWLSRFDRPAIEHFKLGYDWHHQMPCYPMRAQNGTVLGIVYRNTTPIGPKYKYPYGVNKAHLLFNYDSSASNSVVLVEGAVDAIACWEAGHRAFGIYGAQLHDEQIKLLQRVVRQRVVLAMDNDDAGRLATSKIAVQLGLIGFEVVRVDWSEVAAKDIAEAPVEIRRTLLDPLAL